MSAYAEGRYLPCSSIGFLDERGSASHSHADYPTLLDLPTPRVRPYLPASVIAEKFQAMVAMGVMNGRMKDYYDLWAIPRAIEIVPDDLDAAIRATFERRETAVPSERPSGLSSEMSSHIAKQRQWRAYAASLELENLSLEAVISAVWDLVGPSCARLAGEA